MRVAFRADASLQIGSGHVMRCLTLANALRESGASCVFVCRKHVGNLLDLIRQQGFEAIGLPLPEGVDSRSRNPSTSRLAHAEWLGDSWQRDAEHTLAALDGKLADWLVVDHYALDCAWEEALRPACRRLLAIDDLADRDHCCDLLLDQNLVAQMAERYRDRVPSSCRLLLGPRFALLQPHYAVLHARVPPREGTVRCALVYFGGADNANLTGKTISAFLSLGRSDVRLDVVINPDGIHTPSIREQVRAFEHIHIHSRLPSLSSLMMRADIAIGAGGATSWERCCLGLPTLVITTANNQKPIADELHQRGLIRWLGHCDTITEDSLARALQAMIDNKDIERWSRACMAMVDGKGTERVASVLALNLDTPLNARLAQPDDEERLLRWANDPIVRQSAFDKEIISPETHKNWFYARLRDTDRYRIYIVENAEAVPVGQVRFELTKNEWTIDYSLCSAARGRGLGKKLLETALLEFGKTEKNALLVGNVKEDNKASRAIFMSLSFEEERCGGGRVIYRRML